VKITYAALSWTGPVRPHNEDFIGFWQPDDEAGRANRGAIAVLADGLGGHGDGEVASHLAVDTALKTFHETSAVTSNQMLWRIFNTANLAVYEAGSGSGSDRMATTLTVSVFRRNELAVGHVGDSRAYLVRQGEIRQLTSDHTYVAMQLKMNLITKAEAMTSELRSMLTRSLGSNPTVQMDYSRALLRTKDIVIQCSDGLHGPVTEAEMRECVNRMPPEEACDYLLRLAEKRGTQDNLSVQIIRVDSVPRVGYYRGSVAYYLPSSPSPVIHELQPGDVLDERFTVVDVINRSAMSSVFKATDARTGRAVALKVPLPSLEADPAAFQRFEREGEIGQALDHPSILKIIPVDTAERSRPYLVMEYLKGQTLDSLLQRVRPLPEAEALRIMSQVCDGFAFFF